MLTETLMPWEVSGDNHTPGGIRYGNIDKNVPNNSPSGVGRPPSLVCCPDASPSAWPESLR